MKKSLIVLLVLVMMATAAVLVACGEEETDGSTDGGGAGVAGLSVLENPQGYPADPSLTPETGGTMKMILGMTLSNIGAPWEHMPGPNAYVARAVCEELVGIGPDGSRVPQLATSWEADADAKTYTLTLREGVNFQDGTPFNADAVKWNIEKNQETGSNTALMNVSSIEVVDDYTIVLTLAEWDPIFLESLGDNAMIVSPTAYETYGDDIKTHPVGTGPFEFVEFVPDVSVTLQAFDGYWQEGLPYLDGIVVEMVTDSTVRFAAFMNGECDYLEGASAAQVKEAEAEGFESLFMVSGIIGITWDSSSADSPFSDLKVRQAIAMAAPYSTIVDQVFDGMYPTTNQFSVMMDGTKLPGYNEDVEGYTYDEAAALALLEEAGYGLDNPIDVTFTYPQQAEKDDQYAAVQAALAKVGVNITLKSLDNAAWGEWIMAQEAGQMNEWQTGYQLSTPYVRALNDALRPGSTWFPLQSYPDEYATLYDTMVATSDQADKDDLYRQLNKMAVDDYCLAIPLYARTNYKLIGTNLHDMGAGQWAGEYDPSIIWLSK